MNYDFSTLNDKEFEVLCCDLFEAEFVVRIERFKAGKDGGIDGRFYTLDSKTAIIQCKHYLNTGVKGLIRKLKQNEVQKVKKLHPQRYLLATSTPLSPANKQEINTIFHPFITNSSDIFGQDDLNALLKKFPQILEKNFKLWLSGTEVLKFVLNSAVTGRSQFMVKQIYKKSAFYVITEFTHRAWKQLNENRVIIITGEPGIGKTTLAEALSLRLIKCDYELVCIEESISEAEAHFQNNKKQVFYYDDFLGSNYFEAIENKKDSHIVNFISRVMADKTKRFILTSRTGIFNCGIGYSSHLHDKNVKTHSHLLQMPNMKDIDKAKILYNHIWFGDLEERFREEFYIDKRYKSIINHTNFNPRLIEFITDNTRIKQATSSDYWNYVMQVLDKPNDVWGIYFKHQSNEHVRRLVYLTVCNGDAIVESQLRASFDELCSGITNHSHTSKDFNTIASLAVESFLVRMKYGGIISYKTFNPSLTDFIISELSNNTRLLTEIFKSLKTLKSVKCLISLISRELITMGRQNIDEIFADAFNKPKEPDYFLVIANYCTDNSSNSDQIIQFLQRIIDNPVTIGESYRFIEFLHKYWDELVFLSYACLADIINIEAMDMLEAEELAELIASHEIAEPIIISALSECIENNWHEQISAQSDETDWSNFIIYNETEDGDSWQEINEDGIHRHLQKIAREIAQNFNKNLLSVTRFDIASTLDELDLASIVETIIDNHQPSEEELEPDDIVPTFDDIDDLFERT